MVKQALIAALSWPRGVIGWKGRLPWHIPLELRVFRELTWGGILVMGRRTYESLKRPALPGRTLWVLSRHLQVPPETGGVRIFSSWDALLEALPEAQKPVFFAGGEEIFRRALELPSLERLYLSWVMAEVEGDTCFPPIPEAWVPTRWEVFTAGPGVPIPFIFAEYQRKLP
jgi:dihydrofolate reductase